MKPFQPSVGLDRANGNRGLGGKRKHAVAIGPGERPLPQISIGRSAPSSVREGMLAVGDLGEGLGTGAEIVVRDKSDRLLADQPDWHAPLALPDALEDARIEHGGLEARVGADEENGVGLIDALRSWN